MIKIFANAVKLQKYLNEVGICHNKMFFEYDFGKEKEENIQVELRIEKNFTYISDTSKMGSVNDRSLNSYKLGVIYYLFRNYLKVGSALQSTQSKEVK